MFPIIPADWPAPKHIHAFTTTRQGGVSKPPYESFNVGMHVNDDPADVKANRCALRAILPSEPCWLAQEHTTIALEVAPFENPPRADASYTREKNKVCVVMTADCLPILICDKQGSVVSAVHAGWRGLATGILPITLDALGIPAKDTLVWLGPAIGPTAFELRDDVRQAFLKNHMATDAHFEAINDRFLGDMYSMARWQCAQRGILNVYGGGLCTFSDPRRFYSFRRDGETGRLATLIWLT